MDDTLRLIQHLYDEDDSALAQRLTEDDALRREYEQLRDTKESLDQHSSPSPDPDVVDDIVDRAAEAASSSPDGNVPPDGRADRAARAPNRQSSRRLQGVGAVLALLLVAAVGWWQMDAVQTTPASTAASSASSQKTKAATGGEQMGESDGVPAWDDRDDVVRLHRRIEMMRSRSDDGTWDGMPQPVDQAGP